MTSTLLDPAFLGPAADHPAGSVRRTGAAGLAAALAAVADRWLDLVEYRAASRWTHLLPTAAAARLVDPALADDLAGAQVWLLSWLPEQGTPLHDHGDSSGAFAVVRGALAERVVGRSSTGARDLTAELTGGRVRHFGPHYVHQVINSRPEPAVSVHVYAPRLTVMNTYRMDGADLVHTGSERAGVDW
jgi:hypothetical protein